MGDAVFDDPLMRPPSTNATTGTWDDSGTVRGYAFRHQNGRLLDIILEREWKAFGLTCLLFRVTEYYERGRHTRDRPAYGECETYYSGTVHGLGVESFPKGYGGTYITDCYPEDGWFVWDERSWSNGPGYGESMRESAVRKTETLARGLSQRAEVDRD